MGICCCQGLEYVDEDLLKTKNIKEIILIMEEKNNDFVTEKIEIETYLNNKSEYLRMEYIKFDKFMLEKKAKFLEELSITTNYCIKKLKKYQKVFFPYLLIFI